MNFPEFLIELIRYLTGFNIHEYLELKKVKEQEEKDQQAFKKKILAKLEELKHEREI